MAKKIVKKTKIKLLPCFMVLLFFVALSFGAYYFVHLPIIGSKCCSSNNQKEVFVSYRTKYKKCAVLDFLIQTGECSHGSETAKNTRSNL